ncbi:probable inactive receptor kinase at4g23740 [Phtheirospermum japonicum]|uniref:Probable inactive receptor kinase at4g23740 n=1 Tax=Phtheirospermum japonicum TaxID=374723 RepID=A0A830BRZ6_9LAMI|nr:probable inactive receptor kinase at4g23740 [Phtheirospermum japonicum]
MAIVGNIMHENVVALRAYYSSEDERLMLYDYYSAGSVYALFHAGEYGCVSDLGPTNLIETTFLPTANCYAPEIENSRDVFQASDVYSFGVLILELLKRKPTVHVPGVSPRLLT